MRPESMECLPFVLFRPSPNLRAPPAPSQLRSWVRWTLRVSESRAAWAWAESDAGTRGGVDTQRAASCRRPFARGRGARPGSSPVPARCRCEFACTAPTAAGHPRHRPCAPSSSPTRNGGLTRTQNAALRLRESLHALLKECGTWGTLPKMFAVFVLLRFTLIEVGGSQNLARISITGKGYKKALLSPVYSSDSVGLGWCPTVFLTRAW